VVEPKYEPQDGRDKLMKQVLCESVSPGMRPDERTVSVRDAVTRLRSFVRVPADYLTECEGEFYLPVGIVQDAPDQDFALIELTSSPDAGNARLWVRRSDFLQAQKVAP
jgi:hypothetical protein